MGESWMLDEMAHAGAEHLDAGFVAGYDRKQGYPDAGADIAAFAARGLGGTSVVVDLGAGTGQFAVAAARRLQPRWARRRLAGSLVTRRRTARWLPSPCQRRQTTR